MDDSHGAAIDRRRVLGLMGAGAAGVLLPLNSARPAAAASWTFSVGANLSGLEAGSVIPGTPHFDYYVPDNGDLDYLHSRGLNSVRLPIRWERIQPTLNGALDTTYLGFITALLSHAAGIGTGILVDLHNFGGRSGHKIGDGTLTTAHFADVWTKLAGALAGKPGLAGYDIMNEPSNMPAPSVWPQAAQAATDAIRTVDTTTTLYIEGDNWSSAASWVHVNGTLAVSDPSGNIVYSAHTYFDRDSSGTHFDWATEVAAGDVLQSPPGPLTTQIGVQRLTGFADWLDQHGFRGHVGEMGTPNGDPHWLETLDNTLAFCKTRNIPLDYFTSGGWYAAYPMGIEPQADGRDTVQMAVLTKYTGAAAPKPYYLSGPDRGTKGAASAPFTIDYRGYHTQPITITPSDHAGGTFSPSTVTLPAGFNGTATFTYAAPGLDTYTVACTNSGGLTNPRGFGFSTRQDAYSGIDPAGVLNVIAMKRLYTPFVFPGLTLRRATDGNLRSFAFSSSDTLDQSAISAWAGTSDIQVVTAADQSPARRDAGVVVTQNHDAADGSQLNSSPADYPQLILNGLGGTPVMRFHNSRMDALSPIDQLTGFTCFLVCKPTTAASMQRLLSWHFTEYLLLSGSSAGTWQLSGEPDVPMGVDPTAWHIYAARWSAGGSLTTWLDGTQVATAAAATQKITFANDNHVNIGYFRWYHDVYFDGDVWALLPFSTALTDSQMQSVTAGLSSASGIPA